MFRNAALSFPDSIAARQTIAGRSLTTWQLAIPSSRENLAQKSSVHTNCFTHGRLHVSAQIEDAQALDTCV